MAAWGRCSVDLTNLDAGSRFRQPPRRSVGEQLADLVRVTEPAGTAESALPAPPAETESAAPAPVPEPLPVKVSPIEALLAEADLAIAD